MEKLEFLRVNYLAIKNRLSAWWRRMAEKKDESASLKVLVGIGLAILGGAALMYIIAKALSNSPEHYECPNCHELFEGKPQNCPSCNVNFRW